TGFTVVRDRRGVELRLHRPAGPHSLVSAATAPDGAAALLGCLHYQDDLRAALGLADGPADAALALAAYRRCGHEAAARLEGDFALVVWDAARAELVAVRDVQGGYPLFWAAHGDEVTVSTDLFEVLGDRPVTLDAEYLADFLAQADQNNEMAGE